MGLGSSSTGWFFQPKRSESVVQKQIILLALLAFFLIPFAQQTMADPIYKWIDEKGTLNFSDNPSPKVFESQAKNRPLTTASPSGRREGIEKGDSLAVVKNLEIGRRSIPSDMHKYGPGNPIPRASETQTFNSPSRRTRSSGFTLNSGNTRIGNTWTGNHWTGNPRTGNTWPGNQWPGNNWSGNQWTGNK